MYRVGEEVVCVNTEFPFKGDRRAVTIFPPSSFSPWLVKNKIYTVRRIAGDAIWVNEIQGPYSLAWDYDQPFYIERFRRLIKTDISAFEKFKKVRELEEV